MGRAVKNRRSRLGVVDRTKAVMSLPMGDKSAIVEAVRGYLADPSPRVRSAALEVVRDENLRELDQQVVMSLSDKNSFVRYSAVECLGTLHQEESIAASWLYPLMEDPSFLVRVATLESLDQIGDNDALPMIAKRLYDDNALVRAYAAGAIAQLDGGKYVPEIERALEAETDDNARVGFADALFLMGDERQFSELLKLLSSSDYHVRCASANALGAANLKPAQVQSALEAVSHAARNALFRADRLTMERVEKDLREQRKQEAGGPA
ncbi:MAG: HEAT repeat domain-containing protein [Terriglobales bacterium]